MEEKDFNWAGWELKKNLHGEEFDLEARKRMIAGSQMLLPLVKKYNSKLGKNILEIGPFFNPLITPEEFPNKNIFYWENDQNVLKWLSKKYKNSVPIYCDLNKIEGTSLLKIKLETEKEFERFKEKNTKFDSIIISHVFNYIDYKLLLIVLKDFLKKGGLLFINNVLEYGLPNLFSQKRPKNNEEIIQTLEKTGYNILDKKIIPSVNKKHQKEDRLVLVAKNMEVK